MLRFLIAATVITATITSCAPTARLQSTTYAAPVIVKISESAAKGGTLTIQGRYLGAPSISQVILSPEDTTKPVYSFQNSDIQSWSDTQIVIKIPATAPLGAFWVSIQTGEVKSNTSLPFNIKQ